MSTQVRWRRDTATNVAAFTGAQGEVVIDITNNRLVVQDGSTAGGWAAAKLSEVETLSRTAIADAAYTALVTDSIISYTSITAPRAVSLPLAANYPKGRILWIVDESGSASATNYISINRNTSDTIDGLTNAVINAPYDVIALESNGSTAWTILVGSPDISATAVGIGTPADTINPLSVKAGQALFNAISNSFTIYVNKTAVGNNAAVLFEDAFASKAQLGLIGDDNFHFQVYNGSSWVDALNINNSTGLATLSAGKLALSFGTNNSAVGLNALYTNTTGSSNSAVGVGALYSNTTGSNNSAVGFNALYTNTTGSSNSTVGFQALYSNTTGSNNSVVGFNALYTNTTGASNSAVGLQALYSNTTGINNSVVGVNSINANTTGSNNSVVGAYALDDLGQAQTAGSFIVGISYTILTVGTTNFTAIGAASNTVGVVFTATGVGSGTGTATPNTNNNVAFGYNTGRGITYGSNNTIIGAQVIGLAAGLAGAVIIATGDGTSRCDYNVTKTGAWTFSAPIRKPVYTVATLPSASGVGAGACAAVTDATAPVFGSAPVGSGAVFTPVISNGTTWQVG
jgi:hypothetical protein